MTDVNYLLIIGAVFFAIISPGPATVAIASASANNGRQYGSTLAFGIASGGFIWSCAAAFGLSAILYTNLWLFELMRYFGAGYLLFLAVKSLKSAFRDKEIVIDNSANTSLKVTYLKGLALQLSNPKAILTFASVYAIFLPANTSSLEIIILVVSISIMANIVFQVYAYLFSTSKFRDLYFRLRRLFEVFFALFFGVTVYKILTYDFE